MKFKGNDFKKAILEIKKLPNGSKKRAAIMQAAKKYETSDKTIYRELKEKPAKIGMREKRSDAGKDKITIGKKELSLLDELIQAGKTLQQAKPLIEKKLKVKISHSKLNKMSSLLKTRSINDNSNYGSEVKSLISKSLKLDEIGFGKTVPVKFKYSDKVLNVKLTKQDIEQVAMICAARFNMSEFSEKKKLRIDDNRLLRTQLKYIVSEEIQKAMETGSLESLDKLSLIQGRLDDSVGTISPDFELALITIQHEFKDSITPEELLSLFEKYKEELKNA